jgi:hypothetical protein
MSIRTSDAGDRLSVAARSWMALYGGVVCRITLQPMRESVGRTVGEGSHNGGI